MDSVLDKHWFSLTLVEQMVNIGNEVKRAIRFDSNTSKKEMFLNKALELTELTIKDPKNSKVIPELNISKEVLLDYKGEHQLNCPKEKIYNYYMTYTFFL